LATRETRVDQGQAPDLPPTLCRFPQPPGYVPSDPAISPVQRVGLHALSFPFLRRAAQATRDEEAGRSRAGQSTPELSRTILSPELCRDAWGQATAVAERVCPSRLPWPRPAFAASLDQLALGPDSLSGARRALGFWDLLRWKLSGAIPPQPGQTYPGFEDS